MTVSCSRTEWSTCRQTYAASNTITVFLYRYTGNSVRVRPSQCDNTVWAGQCNGARLDENDLSAGCGFEDFLDMLEAWREFVIDNNRKRRR